MVGRKRTRPADDEQDDSVVPCLAALSTVTNNVDAVLEESYKFVVDKLSKLELDKDREIEFKLGQMDKWELVIQRRKDKGAEWMGLHLNSPLNDSLAWSATVEAMYMLVNNDSNKSIAQKSTTDTYNSRDMALMSECPNFIKWKDLMDEKKGYIRDNKITLIIGVAVTKLSGYRLMPTFDFTKQDEINDFPLVIEGKRLYVSRQILASHSSVLRTMFFGSFDEKNKTEIELKDIDYEGFLEMLKVIYPSEKKITDDTVERLITVGNYFDIKVLMSKLEDYLIESETFSVPAKLVLAGKYQLVRLEGSCLETFDDVKSITKLKKCKQYNELSDKIKLALFEKIVADASESDEADKSSDDDDDD